MHAFDKDLHLAHKERRAKEIKEIREKEKEKEKEKYSGECSCVCVWRMASFFVEKGHSGGKETHLNRVLNRWSSANPKFCLIFSLCKL